MMIIEQVRYDYNRPGENGEKRCNGNTDDKIASKKYDCDEDDTMTIEHVIYDKDDKNEDGDEDDGETTTRTMAKQ